jgi:hypothetical protein
MSAKPIASRLDGNRDGPFVPLLAITLVVQLVSLARVLGREGRPPIDGDSAMIQHMGWYVTQGGIPYVHMWDVKPPLAPETAAILATVAGGDALALHLLSIALTAGAAVGTVVLVGLLTYQLTDNRLASVVAGTIVLTHPGFHYLPAFGLRVKYLALFAGLLGIYFAVRGRYLFGAVVATASPAYWHFGVVFPLVVLAMVIQRGDRRTTARALVGMATVTVTVLTPVALWGAVGPMLSEVVLLPLIVPESTSIPKRLARGFLFLGYSVPFVLLGVYGIGRDILDRRTQSWWLVVCAVWFGLQILLFDFDSYPDFFPGLLVVGIGVGLFLADASPPTQRRIAAVVAVVLVVSTVFLGSLGVLVRPLGLEQNDDTVLRQTLITVGEELTGRSVTEPPARGGPSRESLGLPSLVTIYWDPGFPHPCHSRLSTPPRLWIEATDSEYLEKRCSDQ